MASASTRPWIDRLSASAVRDAVRGIVPNLAGAPVELDVAPEQVNPIWQRGTAWLGNTHVVKCWMPMVEAASERPRLIVTLRVEGVPCWGVNLDDPVVAQDVAAALADLHDPSVLLAIRNQDIEPPAPVPQADTNAIRSRLGQFLNPAHMPLVNEWCDWTERVQARPTGQRVILHGDLHGYNLLVRDGRLRCVLDYDAVSVGDHHYDLRYLPGLGSSIEFFVAVVDEYERRTGRPVEPVPLLTTGRFSAAPARGSGPLGRRTPPPQTDHQPRTSKLPRLRQDGRGGPMPRGRTLFWTIIGSVVAAVAVVLALVHVDSGTPSGAASTSAPPTSAGASTQAGESSAPVVTPQTSNTSSLSYLSDLKPAGGLGELVNPGPVKISGSIYPKSISFYCNVGDPTAFPAYKLQPNARRFRATIGLAAGSPSQFQAAVLLVGDGRTLRTVTVSVPKAKAIDVSVKGIHTLRLECFGSGNSYTGGEAVGLAWGNARVSGGR